MDLLSLHATYYPVPLAELLSGREARQARQHEWLACHAATLISFTVVAPGPIKDSELTRRIFNRGVIALEKLAKQAGWEIKAQTSFALATGPERFIAINQPALSVKQATIELEQSHRLGRLWDIDVLTPQGEILSRQHFSQSPRQCLMCTRAAALCARERSHPLSELLARIEAWFNDADNTAHV